MVYNSLDENFPMISQPDSLDIDLMNHQRTSIYAMKELEMKGCIDVKILYYSNTETELRLETQIGILGDKVGSGKTYMLIGLLCSDHEIKSKDIQFESQRFISIKSMNNNLSTTDINLIIIPDHISNQWIDSWNHTKNLKFKRITKATECIIDPKYDIYLVTCSVVNSNTEFFSKYFWKRVIIDEADTIKLNHIDLIGRFVWLVTGTPHGIAYSRRTFIKSMFNDAKGWITDMITIKNTNEYIDASLKLPKPNKIIVRCLTPSEIKLVKDYIPQGVMSMINAGNIHEAIKALNCHVDTDENIFQVITKNIRLALKNKTIELEAEMKKIYTGWAKDEQDQKIQKLQRIIFRLNERYSSLKKKLYEMNDALCPICMCDFDVPTLTDCCATTYCFECLSTFINRSPKCPHCQKLINKYNLHVINKDNDILTTEKSTQSSIRDKLDVLIDILSDKLKDPNSRILIFADYVETFRKIENKLKQLNILCKTLEGSIKSINTAISMYESGKIQVLLLNARNFGSGLNLQMSTDIIIYHRFTKEIEEQVIGRGQRINRVGTLSVYYLIHDNETEAVVNDFDFQDINYETYLGGIDDKMINDNIINTDFDICGKNKLTEGVLRKKIVKRN